MDREPEKRRDLAPACGKNEMGNERFTVRKTTYMEYSGRRVPVVSERRNQAIDGKGND